MRVLTALSHEQLANRPLSAAAKRFLAMIVERRETTAWGYGGSFPVATYDGWYLDLFPHIDTALEDASFIADYATFDRNGQQGVHYLGAKGPRLGVFVIDTGGAPRVMVGPVARAYQHTGPLDHRLDDEAAKRSPASSRGRRATRSRRRRSSRSACATTGRPSSGTRRRWGACAIEIRCRRIPRGSRHPTRSARSRSSTSTTTS